MNRPTVPSVKITLDRERTLRFDFNALAAFEEQTGLNALATEVWSNPTTKTLRAMLWSALLHEDPGLKISDLGALVHSGNIEEIYRKVKEASVAGSPEVETPAGEGDGKNASLPIG